MVIPTLNINVGYGMVAVGNVRESSIFNNYKAPENCHWGSIYKISNYGIVSAHVGESVLYKDSSVEVKLAIDYVQYPIFKEENILATETIAPPMP